MLFSGWLRSRTQRFLGRCLFAAFATSVAACSVLVDSDREQCSTDRDCQKRGGDFARTLCSNSVCVYDRVWGCVGSVTWPTAQPGSSPEKVTASLTLSNLLSKDLVIGATARVCGKLDPKCDSPTQIDLRSDSEGVLTVQLDKYFNGYLEIKYPLMADTMYFFNPPLEKDRVIPFIPLVPFDALQVFGDLLGMLPLLDRGTVIGLSYDCEGNGAEGIELSCDEADENTKAFYMVADYPSLAVTKTDKSGQGGIANVRAGSRFLYGRRADTGEVIGTVSVQSRASWIAYTSMLPTPLSMQK
jgi:hypothetical protein